jgi:hypothetical protein
MKLTVSCFLAAVFAAVMIPTTVQAFPENVRYGYASCSTCHVSPAGGGALTTYGRSASEEFMGMASNKGENGVLHGKASLPEFLILGADMRVLALMRDTGAFKEKAAFPMQADVEFGANTSFGLTAVGTFGMYRGFIDSQRHYVMQNIGDNFFTRVGRFFPAFGIYIPDHEAPTRKGLGFNQGRESYNFELGAVNEFGQIIVDLILKSAQREISDEEKGVSATAAWFAGGKSQIGLSLFSGKGTVWNRQIVGAYVITGLTKSTYLLSEVDQETKDPVESGDASTTKSQKVVGYHKLGWEIVKGLNLFGTYESSVATEGTYDPRQWGAGPGIQIMPRPHFEITGQAQARYDETWSKDRGYLYTLMMHYYL